MSLYFMLNRNEKTKKKRQNNHAELVKIVSFFIFTPFLSFGMQLFDMYSSDFSTLVMKNRMSKWKKRISYRDSDVGYFRNCCSVLTSTTSTASRLSTSSRRLRPTPRTSLVSTGQSGWSTGRKSSGRLGAIFTRESTPTDYSDGKIKTC